MRKMKDAYHASEIMNLQFRTGIHCGKAVRNVTDSVSRTILCFSNLGLIRFIRRQARESQCPRGERGESCCAWFPARSTGMPYWGCNMMSGGNCRGGQFKIRHRTADNTRGSHPFTISRRGTHVYKFRLFFSTILFFVECALNVHSSLIVVQDLTAC